jgi:hypothetical protein
VSERYDNTGLATTGDGLTILDITNPARIAWVGGYLLQQPQGVTAAGSYAYVCEVEMQFLGLQIFDVTNPSVPSFVGWHRTDDFAWHTVLSGSYACISANRSGLDIVDVSNPKLPVPSGYFDTAGTARRTFVAGSYAYVADEEGGLVILRVYLRGDTNCDWQLTSDGDLNSFVLALSDPDDYQRRYPDCNVMNADCNDDGRINFADINPFVELLSGG